MVKVVVRRRTAPAVFEVFRLYRIRISLQMEEKHGSSNGPRKFATTGAIDSNDGLYLVFKGRVRLPVSGHD
jgi:hypothetical protein